MNDSMTLFTYEQICHEETACYDNGPTQRNNNWDIVNGKPYVEISERNNKTLESNSCG